MVNIKNFQSRIKLKIINRGLSYYNDGLIEEVNRIGEFEFVGVVQGTDEYNLHIKFNENLDVINHNCDCPYDWGDYCKHIVALMYYINELELYDEPFFKSNYDYLKEVLDKKSKAEIINLLIELSKKNKNLRRALEEYL